MIHSTAKVCSQDYDGDIYPLDVEEEMALKIAKSALMAAMLVASLAVFAAAVL